MRTEHSPKPRVTSSVPGPAGRALESVARGRAGVLHPLPRTLVLAVPGLLIVYGRRPHDEAGDDDQDGRDDDADDPRIESMPCVALH